MHGFVLVSKGEDINKVFGELEDFEGWQTFDFKSISVYSLLAVPLGVFLCSLFSSASFSRLALSYRSASNFLKSGRSQGLTLGLGKTKEYQNKLLESFILIQQSQSSFCKTDNHYKGCPVSAITVCDTLFLLLIVSQVCFVFVLHFKF